MPERHGRTDRQTDGPTDRIAISISRVSVLTRYKKGPVVLTRSVFTVNCRAGIYFIYVELLCAVALMSSVIVMYIYNRSSIDNTSMPRWVSFPLFQVRRKCIDFSLLNYCQTCPQYIMLVLCLFARKGGGSTVALINVKLTRDDPLPCAKFHVCLSKNVGLQPGKSQNLEFCQ